MCCYSIHLKRQINEESSNKTACPPVEFETTTFRTPLHGVPSSLRTRDLGLQVGTKLSQHPSRCHSNRASRSPALLHSDAHPPAQQRSTAASQSQPIAAYDYVMQSQSQALEMTSVVIFSWYIRVSERCCRFGSWRVSARRGCGMCSGNRYDNKWQLGGDRSRRVPLENKVRSLSAVLSPGTVAYKHCTASPWQL
jgi:hypothetical protein